MNAILWTTLFGFVLICICAIFLGIGMLLTGKSKLRSGMCGRMPTKKQGKNSSCGEENSCHLCGKEEDSSKGLKK